MAECTCAHCIPDHNTDFLTKAVYGHKYNCNSCPAIGVWRDDPKFQAFIAARTLTPAEREKVEAARRLVVAGPSVHLLAILDRLVPPPVKGPRPVREAIRDLKNLLGGDSTSQIYRDLVNEIEEAIKGDSK